MSVDSDGNEADTSGLYLAEAPAISADGRYVAFSADAYNLVADDTNSSRDIFVHERDIETAGSLFHDDMQSGLDNWTLEGSDGAGGSALWTHTEHRFRSAGSALYYGKTDTLDYDTGKRNFGSATSIPIDLTMVREAQLSFYHDLHKEDHTGYDIGRVQLSIDDGARWEDVYVASQSTEGEGLQRVDISLAAYAGQVIRLRFSFDTGDALHNNYEGWVIDDVSITEIKSNPAALFQDDMESGTGNWAVEGDDGLGGPALWHLSQHRFISSMTAFYYGQADTLDYNTGDPNWGAITSVPIDLSDVAAANLSFQHFLRKENSSYYDAARVQVSVDEGASWEDIYVPSASSAGDGFTQVDVSLSAYVGQVIRLRFSFDTVDHVDNHYEGWVIDDVLIEAERP